MLLTKKDVKLRKVIETDGKGIDLVMIKVTLKNVMFLSSAYGKI